MKIQNYEVIVSGNAAGKALVSPLPLSFWGGVNPATGVIIDVHNPLQGTCLAGRVFCLPQVKGSCTGSAVLLELIRAKVSPAAILCLEAEPIIVVSPIISKKIYGIDLPIRKITQEQFQQIQDGCSIRLTEEAILIGED